MYCGIIDMRYAQLPASTIHEQVFTCNLSAGTVVVAHKSAEGSSTKTSIQNACSKC